MMLRSLVLGLAVAMLAFSDVAHCLDCDGGTVPAGWSLYSSDSCTTSFYISFFRCCYPANSNECYCPDDAPRVGDNGPVTTTTTPTTTTTTPTTTTTTPTTTTTTPTTTTTTPTTTTTTPTTTTTTPTTTTTTPTTTTTTPTTTTTTPTTTTTTPTTTTTTPTTTTTTTPTTTTSLPQLCPTVTWENAPNADVNPRLYQGTSVNAADCEDYGLLGFIGNDTTDSKLYVQCNGAVVYNTDGRVVIETSQYCFGQITADAFTAMYGFFGTQSFEFILDNFAHATDSATGITTLTPNSLMEDRLQDIALATPGCENVACSYDKATMQSYISFSSCFFLSWGKNEPINGVLPFPNHDLLREINSTIADKNPQRVNVYLESNIYCDNFVYAPAYSTLETFNGNNYYCFKTRAGSTGSLCGTSDGSAPLYCETNPAVAQPATVLFGYAAPINFMECDENTPDVFVVREHKKTFP